MEEPLLHLVQLFLQSFSEIYYLSKLLSVKLPWNWPILQKLTRIVWQVDSHAVGIPTALALSSKEACKTQQTYLPPPSQSDEAGASRINNPPREYSLPWTTGKGPSGSWDLKSPLMGMYPKSEGSTGGRQCFEMSAALNQRRSLSSSDPDLDLNWVLHSLNLMPISWIHLPAPVWTLHWYSLHGRGAGHHWQLLSKFAHFAACLNDELCWLYFQIVCVQLLPLFWRRTPRFKGLWQQPRHRADLQLWSVHSRGRWALYCFRVAIPKADPRGGRDF